MSKLQEREVGSHWVKRTIIIQDTSTKPTPAEVFHYFLNKLKADPNNEVVLEDLVKAGKCGDIPQYAINALLNKLYPKEVMD